MTLSKSLRPNGDSVKGWNNECYCFIAEADSDRVFVAILKGHHWERVVNSLESASVLFFQFYATISPSFLFRFNILMLNYLQQIRISASVAVPLRRF